MASSTEKEQVILLNNGTMVAPEKRTSKVQKEEREAWSNKAEFLLATIGLAVGLGNIWRFPYLCQKNGGGAFLVPFLIFMVIEGIPLFFIELGIGQRFRKTAVEVWRDIDKSLTGIGISSMIVSTTLCIYYIIVITWCIYYLYLSLAKELPWVKSSCHKYDVYMKFVNIYDNKSAYGNQTAAYIKSKMNEHNTCCLRDTPQYYWYEKTLMVSKHMEDVGIGINTNLLISLAIVWVLIYLCIVKGIKSSGKAVYFTATFPYVVLIILFVRGATLPGAMDGVIALFTPKWELLKKPEIWMDAATQIFFSLSLGFGALIAFASYNPINNNIIRDAYIIVLTDCGTALFGGAVVFMILGYRQHISGVPVTEGGYGPGLAFVTFSDVMTLMDLSPLWAALFFLMLILLGIDSEFGILEGIIAPLYDLKLVKMKKFAFLPIVILIVFAVDLPMISGPGFYIFQIFDDYAVNIPLLVIALAQCIAIGWVYGTDKFGDDIEFMTGKRPWKFWMFCWKYLSPTALLAVLVWMLVATVQEGSHYSRYIGCPQITNGTDWSKQTWTVKTPYPLWAKIIAGVLVVGTLLPIPVFIIKEWPKNWKQLFKNQFCSGIKNYMPDPSTWEDGNKTDSMIYDPKYQQEENV